MSDEDEEDDVDDDDDDESVGGRVVSDVAAADDVEFSCSCSSRYLAASKSVCKDIV